MMYSRAKLANILSSRELYAREGIGSCSCHIGAVASKIWDVDPAIQPAVDFYADAAMRTIEQGSRIMLRCAFDNKVRDGAYLDGMGYVRTDEKLTGETINKKLAEKLWSVSEDLVKEWKLQSAPDLVKASSAVGIL